jgi:hypothetical protein
MDSTRESVDDNVVLSRYVGRELSYETDVVELPR